MSSLDRCLGLVKIIENKAADVCFSCGQYPNLVEDCRGYENYECGQCGLTGPSSYDPGKDGRLRLSGSLLYLKKQLQLKKYKNNPMAMSAIRRAIKDSQRREREFIKISKEETKTYGTVSAESRWNSYIKVIQAKAVARYKIFLSGAK